MHAIKTTLPDPAAAAWPIAEQKMMDGANGPVARQTPRLSPAAPALLESRV